MTACCIRWPCLLAGALTFALLPAPLDASRRPGDSAQVAVAEPREGAIRIDGRLDEEAWDRARIVEQFVQGEPIEGAAPLQPTRVRILFDREAIYIAAHMIEGDTARIARQLVRRDDYGAYDFFDVSIDPNHDRRTGYRFRVGASGVQSDAYLYDDVRDDRSWDAVWESAVQVVADGWVVEMRIPLSQIRYEPSEDPQTWGVNFSRRRTAAAERTFFALESRRVHGRVSVFGRLEGLVLPRGARRIEARPYALARTRSAPVDPANPFFTGRETGTAIGTDLRFGIGGSFTLDATVNPDFGQVEVDPAVINLSAFETFFPEKRPFFVEDARVFDFNLSGGDNRLFYSRRVGRTPQRSLSADAVDIADQTSILGAAKLTGRTSRGLSIGALAALTQRETGRAYFAAADSVAEFAAEPQTYHGVLRARQDFGQGRSQLGAIFTMLERDLPDDRTFAFLPQRAFSGGLDFEHSWSSRSWAVWGFFAMSHVAGDSIAMIRLQRSSNHYFQRPDAPNLSVDSAATSMTGAEWRVQLEKRSGRHWTGAVWLAERTPGFEINDLGFSRGGERLDGGARISYQDIEPGRYLRSYRVSSFMFWNWRHEALREPLAWNSWERARKSGMVNANGNVTFLNYWDLDAGVRYAPGKLEDGGTRGGPLMVDPAEVGGNARLSTDRRKAISGGLGFGFSDGEAGSSFRVGAGVTVRPSPRLEVQLEPSFERSESVRQYIGRTADLGFAPTYGPRYIFGSLERRSVSLETRLDVTFTRTLTLQLFAQPLLSYGRYPGYKALARAESFEFDEFARGTTSDGGATCVGGRACEANGRQYLDLDGDGDTEYSFSTPDFDVRSLRGNAVLRWEYRPGSTLFVVWQQARYRNDPVTGDFGIGRSASALFDTHPENVFIVKLSYWLGL